MEETKDLCDWRERDVKQMEAASHACGWKYFLRKFK